MTNAPSEERRERLYNIHIYCDFDGTISTTDIGWDLFNTFGEQEPWHTQLMSGEIGIREYWQQMARHLHTPLTHELLDTYLRELPIDPGFAELVELARAEGFPLTVVSDGLDLYINRYLALHGITGVEVFCNQGLLSDEGALSVSHQYAAEGCQCLSATCKRNVVIWRTAPEDRIVYIGDGVSDFCPAEHADIIFAKKQLAAYCNRQRLPHYPYKTLSEVVRQLRLLLLRRRIRPRHQAHLLRKGVWEGE
jgi:2,3-diketo-5-methylthio-1-phosphopentane phosphatase